jgi:hypothetical protein
MGNISCININLQPFWTLSCPAEEKEAGADFQRPARNVNEDDYYLFRNFKKNPQAVNSNVTMTRGDSSG